MGRSKLTRTIDIEEYKQINGIEQYLHHRGTSAENPVMLFLHGGPGSAESLFAYLFQDKWEEVYTVVHWDQRGAGKHLQGIRRHFPQLKRCCRIPMRLSSI